MKKNKMTRDAVPDGFTLSLALVDAVPVLFFGASMILAGMLLKSPLFMLGAALCLAAGTAKVIWKIIVVTKRRNIWGLFVQMRILMPVGLLLMIAGAALSPVGVGSFLAAACCLPQAGFFATGIAGMALMLVFAFRLDSGDVRANWIEQVTNGLAQAAFFAGFLMIVI